MANMTDKREVMFDRAKLARLKAAHKAAEKAGIAAFVFDGDEYVVGYAKYMIEYLETKL
jgi:stalled ribosome rescue protein Dom34